MGNLMIGVSAPVGVSGKSPLLKLLAELPDPSSVPGGTTYIVTNYGGNVATVVAGAWRFSYPFRTTWAAKPPLGLVPAGTELQVSDYGNQKFISDGAYWRPAQGRALLYAKWGSVASPLAVLSGITAGVFSLAGGGPRIPAGMIPPHSKLFLQVDARKVGGAATAVFYAYLGVAGSTADAVVTATNMSIATNMDACVTAAARFGTSKTSLNTRTWLGDGTTSASSSNVLFDRSGNINTDSDMFLTFGVGTASASDVFNLIGCTLSLEA